MMEMNVIMVLTARQFDITLGYEGLDKAKKGSDIRTVYGERAYQVQRAQPQGDFFRATQLNAIQKIQAPSSTAVQ